MNRWASLCLLLATGCAHQESFAHHEPVADGPFAGGAPLRLTYNVGADAFAAWSADGQTLYYTAQDSFAHDKDRCIFALPAGGGVQRRLQCPPLASNDTTEMLEQAAVLGTNLAWARNDLGVIEHSPFRHTLWLAPTRPDAPGRLLQTFPYTAPSGRPHDAPLFLQWLRPGVLLYLGAQNGCCRKDTLRFGEQVVLLDVAGATPIRTFVPGTTTASAVSASADGLRIYYTFTGDSRVIQQDLSTGDTTLVHDFGPGHIVRDPQVHQTRLVAILDGQPGYRDFPPLGFGQVDYGGHLVTVDLATGIETLLPDSGRFYKRPRLSPDGRSFIAEGFPYVINIVRDPLGQIISTDTVASKWADLWRFEE
jgi:hypothetical protein